MRPAYFGVGWVSACGAAAALAIVSCGKGPPKPGFEEVGGSGGSATNTVASTTVSSTHASTTVGATTTVSSSATTTVASSSSGPVCDDPGPGEPNDTEPTAFNLGTIDDCDGSGDVTSGVLDGTFDVDWFVFQGNDVSLCTVDPTRALQSSAPVRMCKFIQCKNGETANFSCPSGTTSANSPQGRPGCCAFGDFSIGDLSCGGSALDSDDTWVYIRIDNPQASPCPSYTVTYHY